MAAAGGYDGQAARECPALTFDGLWRAGGSVKTDPDPIMLQPITRLNLWDYEIS